MADNPTNPGASIDWKQLANDLGTLRPDGESGGTYLACQALERILGDSEWRAAVDYYVRNRQGYELARSVLWLVRPWAAMERCHELFCYRGEQEVRRSAIELLRVVADRRVLPRVREYLADQDAVVQCWAAGIVDQLLWSELVEVEECEDLLTEMEDHQNPRVVETAEWIRSFLRAREQRANSAEKAE